MQTILRSLTDFTIIKNLVEHVNEEERRLVTQSLVIGVVVWAAIFFLKTAVHGLFQRTLVWLENGSPFLVFLPLITGSLIVVILSRTHASTIHYRDKSGHIHPLNDVEGDGLERAISLYFASEPTFEQALTGEEGVSVRWQLPTVSLGLRKLLATLATLGLGGSGGLEASVALIGESLAAGLFKPRQFGAQAARHLTWLERMWVWWRPDNPDDLQTAQLSGIAAAVAVLLGAPFAAAFFATEIMYRRRPIIEKLVYALLSALVAFFLTDLFTPGHPTIFPVEALFVPPADWRYFGVLTLMSALISLVSIYFRRLRTAFEHLFPRLTWSVWRRHLTGAILTGAIAVVVSMLTHYLQLTERGLELVLGPGEGVIEMALAGELTVAVALIALFAKMLATLTTVSFGGSAGFLVPSLFFGTTVAAILAQWFGYEPMMLIIPAMTASLISIVNVPLAAILFTVEAFGTPYMLPALFVLVVTSLLALDNTIYRSQREVYDSRQILPGVSVRRVKVPFAWHGRTLIDLDFRKLYELTVIGLVEQETPDGGSRVRLGMTPAISLQSGDILVVLGPDEKLEALETAVAHLAQPTEHTSTPPPN